MPLKALSWIFLVVIFLASVILFNYWSSFQPLNTLAYIGIVAAFLGVANLVFPFRFLGIRKRIVGAAVLVFGIALAYGALSWPARTFRVAQHTTVFDDVMPEYQFSERHSIRVHASPEHALQAARQSTFGDMKSLATLLKIRGIVSRHPYHDDGKMRTTPIIDAFGGTSGLIGGSDHEVAVFWAWNARENRPPSVHTLKEFADCHEQGAVKMGFNFTVEDAGNGWSKLTTETRMLALDDATRRGAARYWRLIVPGSGLLRREWLDGIKTRAENSPAS